jgi:hypothetical protein
VEEDGSRIFKKYAKPALADLKEVGAHHAISSLFGQYPAERPIYCYRIEQEDYRQWKNGKTVLAAGKVVIQSEITTGSLKLDFGVVHLGDHSVSCGIREFGGDEKYEGMVKEISSAFESADFPETIRILHRHFGDSIYSLKSLFRSEQKKILDVILESKVTAAEAVYRQLYENHVPLMRFLKESGGTVPKALSLAAEYAMNADLIQALGQDEINEDEVKRLIQAAKEAGIGLDVENLEYVFRRNLERMAEDFSSNPGDLVTLETLHQAVNLVDSMPFRVNIWSAQNVCYNILKSTYPEMLERAGMGDRAAREWVGHFIPLAEKLSLKIP